MGGRRSARSSCGCSSAEGRCPGCGGLLLHADQEPQSPDEWEQWLKGLRKAIRRTAVTVSRQATGRDCTLPDARQLRETPKRQLAQQAQHCSHLSLRACLSRVPGNRASTVLRGPRRGNAPRLPDNTAADHIALLDAALAQIPDEHRHGYPVLVRADGAGSSKAFLAHIRSAAQQRRASEFSIGWAVTAREHAAIAALPKRAWTPAIDIDGDPRESAAVAELTGAAAARRRWPTTRPAPASSCAANDRTPAPNWT